MCAKELKKLELTWAGKDAQINYEPRILLEQKDKSYGEINTENMLIHGDNLLALKSLESEFTGKIKCIYIDPPYNTGNAFEYYDDGVEHSIWLSLMRDRLEILRNLLSNDGVIFVQLDDNEGAYFKVLMDEVFGRQNYINTICVKTKNSSGASGGGEDRRLKKNIEFIFAYSKSEQFSQFTAQYEEIPLEKYISEASSFAYNSVLYDAGEKTYFGSTQDGKNEEIKIFKHTNYIIKSISQIAKEENIKPIEVYEKYFDKIYTLENAQTSIRTRLKDATDEEDNFYTIEYMPVSGRNKGQITEVGFMGKTKRLVSFLKYTCVKTKKEIYKRIKIGTLWTDMSWSAIAAEGGVDFPQSKKPEKLIQRIFDMTTNEGDIILDSFLGSGTTAAVAHKMGRRWIGIELGDHAYTHCMPRMKAVVDGTNSGGISKVVGWTGGGGFKFYELASSLIVKDARGFSIISKEYNGDMLAESMCKIMGYKYRPDKAVFWKQGVGTEKNWLFTTTMTLTEDYLDEINAELGDESLLICCGGFTGKKDAFKNITIKKIPKAILEKCEWNKPGYPLPVREDFSEKDFEIEGE